MLRARSLTIFLSSKNWLKEIMLRNINDLDTPWYQEDMLNHDHVDVRGTHPVLVTGSTGRELRHAPRSISVAEARAWVPPHRVIEESNKRLDAVRILR